MIHAWAALEGMAARLATRNASDEELHELHELQSIPGEVRRFKGSQVHISTNTPKRTSGSTRT